MDDGTYIKQNGEILKVEAEGGYFVGILEVPDIENVPENVMFGVWTNDDVVFVDIVLHIKDEKEAVRLGALARQKAIWDVKNKCEIWVLETIESYHA